MMRALWSAASGMKGQQTNIDVISNNLSNVNTTGYKQSRAEFQDLLYQTVREFEADSPTGLQIGLGVRPSATQKLMMQGSLEETGNNLDVAIDGEGFFRVELPDGTEAYTRDGSFKLDGDGNLVTSDGYFVVDEDGTAITLDEDQSDVEIASDGTVTVRDEDGDPEELAQLTLANVVNPAGLESLGRNLYGLTEAAGELEDDLVPGEGAGSLVSGYLEGSNVQVVDEMVDMIVAQRAYETNSRAIQASDEMLSIANQLRR